MTPRQPDFAWLAWTERDEIAEGVRQTVQEIQTERERIAEIERLYEQLKQRVDDMHQELKELEQRVNVLDNPAH